jgi:hypothetical protein
LFLPRSLFFYSLPGSVLLGRCNIHFRELGAVLSGFELSRGENQRETSWTARAGLCAYVTARMWRSLVIHRPVTSPPARFPLSLSPRQLFCTW